VINHLDTIQRFHVVRLTHVTSSSLVGGLAFSLAYGISTKPSNDPYIHLAEQAIEPAGRAVVPGAYLVDILPFLKRLPEWVPGAGFKKDARMWREMMETYRDGPFEEARSLIVSRVVALCSASQAEAYRA
jgi:hypothetical protein